VTDLITLGGSIAASVLGAGVAAWAAAAMAFRGRIRDYETKVTSLEASTEERVKSWQIWREGLEPRWQEQNAVRDTATAVWRAETATVLSAQDERQRLHEVECRERWLKFMDEHGQVKAKLDILLLNAPVPRRR
jgi:hypothetical protein